VRLPTCVQIVTSVFTLSQYLWILELNCCNYVAGKMLSQDKIPFSIHTFIVQNLKEHFLGTSCL